RGWVTRRRVERRGEGFVDEDALPAGEPVGDRCPDRRESLLLRGMREHLLHGEMIARPLKDRIDSRFGRYAAIAGPQGRWEPRGQRFLHLAVPIPGSYSRV